MSNYYDYYNDYNEYRKGYGYSGKGFGWYFYHFIICILLVCCTLLLFAAFKGRKNPDDGLAVFGKELRLVLSDSMAGCAETDVSGYAIKSLPVNTLISIERVPEEEAQAKAWYDNLKKGDVLTFRYVYDRQETITHRITAITPKGEGYIIDLQGDNKNSDSETLTQTIDTTDEKSLNYVIGKVVWQNYPLGVVMSWIRTPVGIVSLIILPGLLLFSCEIYVISKQSFERKMQRSFAQKGYGNTNKRNDYFNYYK